MTDAARRPRPAPRGPRWRRRRLGPGARLAAAVAGALLAVLAVGAALAAPGDGESAPDRVRVDGVDVSGLSPDEVRRAVRQRARELMRVPVTIERADDPSFRLSVSRAQLGARPRVGRAVEEALEPRSFGGRLLSRLGVAGTREVPLEFSVDERRLGSLVDRIAGRLNDPPVPARLRVGDDDIEVLPGRGGFGVDAEELRERVRALPRAVSVTVGPLDPPVSEEAAEETRRRALRLLEAPVQVTLDGRGVPIEPAVLREALRFEPDPPRLRLTLDPDVLYEDIRAAFETREQPARDASFRIAGTRVRLVPSRVGRRLDMERIAAAIAARPGQRAVRARFEVSRPDLTTREARALRITELVSEFSTPYGCCEPRVTNIQRAAEILDGMIIPPGGRFSLNEALGPRTLERGFVAAPQIAAGRLEDAVGGGVSQVATTMYNAAFFAGVDLVAHTPHQFYISRYPEGREATVSYGGPELVFVNDWEAGILIDASAWDTGIAIRFFSSRLGRRVETATGERRDFVQPRVRETVDRSLEPGERVVEQEMGGAGFTVSYTRKVWRGDELRRDETYTWRYSPQDAFVRVGPAAPKPPRRPPGRTTTEPETETAPAEPEAPPARTRPATTAGGASAPPPPG